MGVLTLADGRERIDILTEEPEGYSVGEGVLEIPLSAFGDAIVALGRINKGDFRLSAVASDTVPDQPLDVEGNAITYGPSNFEGNLTALRFHDAETGQVDVEADILFATVGHKGARCWYSQRKGPRARVPLAVGDEGWIWEMVSDEPQEPADRAGWLKNPIPLGYQSRRPFRIVADD